MPSRASLHALSVLWSKYILQSGTSVQYQHRRCGIGLATSPYCDWVSVFDTGVPERGVSTAIASEKQHGERGVDGVRARTYVTIRKKVFDLDERVMVTRSKEDAGEQRRKAFTTVSVLLTL